MLGKPPDLVVNAEESRSEPWFGRGFATWLHLKTRWKKMDHLMGEKLIKIIKIAQWGKSHQNFFMIVLMMFGWAVQTTWHAISEAICSVPNLIKLLGAYLGA